MDSSSRLNYYFEFNIDDIQALQDAFCKSQNMYIICVSKAHGNITSFSGTQPEEDFANENFDIQIRDEIIDSFVDGDVENIIERYGSLDYLIYRGVAIRDVDGTYLGVWLCFGVNKELLSEDVFIPQTIKRTTEEEFNKSVSLLEQLTHFIISEKHGHSVLYQEVEALRKEKNEMSHRIQKNEIITEILSCMETENSFTKVSEDILSEAGLYLSCTHASLLRLSSDGVFVDMISEWHQAGSEPMIDTMQGINHEHFPFINGKPYTISSDATLPYQFDKFFKAHGIVAGIFLPIYVNTQPGMYLCFMSVDVPRKWTVDDLRFANDVKRVIHTILSKRIIKNSLASSYTAVEAILQNTGCGVVVSDVNLRQNLYVNDTFSKMFDNEIDRLAVDEILFEDSDYLQDLKGFSANATGKWYDVTFANINWVDGRLVRLTTFYDITELKAYQKQVEKQASEDILTGLYNRQRCEKDIEAEFHFSISTGKEFAVLMIDLDDFTNINEGLGHENGDLLLKYIAHAINNISHITGHCYRVGGDEFAILVDHDAYDKLELIVKRIQHLFDNPWTISEQEFYCTMSMGAVRVPQDAPDSTSILTRLNMALHEAKNNGKNRFEFFDQNTDCVANERLEMEKAMRKSVEHDCQEFEVYYQPIFSLNEDETVCCGAEALARWNSSELGFVVPDKFIPLAEYLGLIIPIGEHVLFEACRRCKHWNDFGHPEFKVNVNLSVVQLTQTDIVSTVKRALEETGLDPHNLTLEVTESLAINDMGRMVKILDNLRQLRCRVALDDFGTGYSSLNHIRSMPIDTIKIDKAFVQDMGANNFSETFVKTVAELAESLHMDVCVEGVEEEQQLFVISKFFVNVAQGYLFDKPLQADSFEKKYL